MSAADWIAVRLTAELAALTTVLLLIVGTPIAWWLARTRSAGKPLVASLVAMPLVLPPSVLGFAHTVGEFGVVLMIGGNIPGATRVLSVAVYEHVEATEFDQAHRLAAGMVVFALLVLLTLYALNRRVRPGTAIGAAR